MFLKNHIKICRVLHNVMKKSVRSLELMEYQSKELMQKYGFSVQDFCMVNQKIGFKDFDNFVSDKYVVKAQALTGGRGKGHFDTGFKGGVHIINDKQNVKTCVNEMLGHRLITKQTTKKGVLVNDVMVASFIHIDKETYVCLALDRVCNGPVIVVSPAGGVDIETIAAKSPHLLLKYPVDIYDGITEELGTIVCDFLRFKRSLREAFVQELRRLWNFFIKCDALQVEINPLVSTQEHTICCVDAKFQFDNNAKFRQQEIFSLESHAEVNPTEILAAKYHLNYIKLNGNIGCLVNGAGLAMATMDLIKLYGGSPANFLDISGSVNARTMKIALNLVLSDENVQVVLVNVFGGIVNCAMVAIAICEVAKGIQVPLIARLEGTNAKNGRALLRAANLEGVEIANDFAEAAQKAVTLVKCK